MSRGGNARYRTMERTVRAMERLTDTAWRNLDSWECCGQDNYCQRGCHNKGGCTNGCIVPRVYHRLAAYEDTGITPEEIKALREENKKLKEFKEYFDDLCGIGLKVANWHMNGELEPFDSFYDSAVEFMKKEKVYCKDCDFLNMDSGKPYCRHSHMSINSLDDWCDFGTKKQVSR